MGYAYIDPSGSSLTARRRCNIQRMAANKLPQRHPENAEFHRPGATNKLNSKRINGAALEMIMHDVLHGIHGFTSEVCSGSEAGKMEIIAVEEAEKNPREKARVIPFPGTAKKT